MTRYTSTLFAAAGLLLLSHGAFADDAEPTVVIGTTPAVAQATEEEPAVVIGPAEDTEDDEDRHAGYYYPPVTSRETYGARARTIPEANRSIRVAFITGLEVDLLERGYPIPFAIFAKGTEAQKLIVVALMDGPFDTLYRARAMLTTLTATARTLPILKQNRVEDWFTFYDLAVLLGFEQITISDGKTWSHQVVLTPPP